MKSAACRLIMYLRACRAWKGIVPAWNQLAMALAPLILTNELVFTGYSRKQTLEYYFKRT
jgi:hypothetical protein